ncbi:MAG: hypothetical protein ABII18_04220 [bacterium]|nr:hypothetical protein [bacterium]MBU1918090.1 hypothetical protein [bacterium]
MNLEKLGVLVFLKYFQEFGGARKHLVASLRELLLATSESIEATNRITAENQAFKKIDSVETILALVNDIVKTTAGRLRSAEGLATKISEEKIKKEMMQTMIEAINEEIEQVSDRVDPHKQAKIDALMTVRNVFTRQLYDDYIYGEEVDGWDESDKVVNE